MNGFDEPATGEVRCVECRDLFWEEAIVQIDDLPVCGRCLDRLLRERREEHYAETKMDLARFP